MKTWRTEGNESEEERKKIPEDTDEKGVRKRGDKENWKELRRKAARKKEEKQKRKDITSKLRKDNENKIWE